ncbi:MAG: L,D-transpeptidase [Candidatus Nanopelagicales bacterium]
MSFFRALTPSRLAIGAVAGTAALGLTVIASASAFSAPPSPTPAATPAASSSAPTITTPAPESSASPIAKPKKPKPASRTKKAKNIPERPRDKFHGKRLVYDKALMTVWMMNAKDEVVGRYPVVGRWDRPAKGTYHIFSKSKVAYNPNSKVTFNNMMRFTYGPDTKSPIGFHSIPKYYDGTPMHSVKQLGLPIARGGCVRLSEEASKELYKFMKVGDLVVVLPSP